MWVVGGGRTSRVQEILWLCCFKKLVILKGDQCWNILVSTKFWFSLEGYQLKRQPVYFWAVLNWWKDLTSAGLGILCLCYLGAISGTIANILTLRLNEMSLHVFNMAVLCELLIVPAISSNQLKKLAKDPDYKHCIRLFVVTSKNWAILDPSIISKYK